MARLLLRFAGSVALFALFTGFLQGRQDEKDKEDPRNPTIDGKKASVWVDTLVNGPSARGRALAVEALGKAWREKLYDQAPPNLGRSLRLDTSAAVRAQAAIVLAELPSGTALKVLPKELGVLVENARKDLIQAMGSEKESRVRREIARALSRDPALAKAAVAELTAALKDPEPATLIAIAETLAQAGAEAKPAAAGLAPLLGHADKGVRMSAVMTLGRISPEGATAIGEAMAKMLSAEKDADIKTELLTSLGLLGEKSPAVVAAIGGVLADPDDDLRRRAARTLGTFGTAAKPAAAALLKAASTDKAKDIRVDAVHGLGSALGPDGVKQRVKDFLALLADPEHEVRIAVLGEVGALGNDLKDDQETIKVVRTRLSDPHLKVREAASIALRKITEKKKEPDPKKEPEKK